MKRIAGVVLLVCGLAGCVGDSESWMPLEEGNVWHMKVTAGLTSNFMELKVDKPIPVGQHSGWELTSRMGMNRMAWHRGTLYASYLAGTSYSPPLPLLAELGENQTQRWKGSVTTGPQTDSAAGSLSVKQTKEKIGVRSHPAREATVVMTVGKLRHEIQTSFVRGIGIVRQEHRVDGALVNRVSYSSGP